MKSFCSDSAVGGRNSAPPAVPGVLSLELKGQTSLCFHSVAFVTDDIASSVVNAAIKDGYTEIGWVWLTNDDGPRRRVSKIYCRQNNVGDVLTSTCLVYLCDTVPDSLHYHWARLFLSHPECRYCLALGGVMQSSFTHSQHVTTGEIRILRSSAAQQSKQLRCPQCKRLETGNLLSGCTAAIICLCEYSSVDLVVCVSIRGSSCSYEAAMAFQQVAEELKAFLDIQEETLRNCLLNNNVVKNDAFLSRTVNMYV